jgi:FO synthase subunit 2
MAPLSETPIRTILEDILGGYRITKAEAIRLFQESGEYLHLILDTANQKRADICGPDVTYVRNQNVNCTNICVNSCGFCGYSRRTGDSDAFLLTPDDIRLRVREAQTRGVTEICTVSGLHPDFSAESYCSIYSTIREEAPGLHIHASNPMEVAYAARKSAIPTTEVLERFRNAGLKTLCGTAAEILSDPVREVICPDKVTTSEWIRIITEAHRLGIPSTATIMYGSCETLSDRITHLDIIREIQDNTGMFTEFVPLSYVHAKTPLFLEGKSYPGATGRQDLLMIAISRLFLDNFRNIQVSWVKLGQKMAQLGLLSGANDLGGTLYCEQISRSAGSDFGEYLEPGEMEYICSDIHRPLRERYTDYTLVP